MRAKYPVDDMYIIGGLQVFALVMYAKWARRSVTFHTLWALERKSHAYEGYWNSYRYCSRGVLPAAAGRLCKHRRDLAGELCPVLPLSAQPRVG